MILGGALAGGSTVTEAADPEKQRVIVAKQQLHHGHRLKKDDLRWVEWPADAVPEGAFTSVEALFGAEEAGELRIVLRPIEAGEPLLRTKISGFGTSTRSAAGAAEGMRAFTVPIDDTGGGGFINPGDRVDVILTTTADGELLSKVMIQDVPVIAVDRIPDERPARVDPSTATIEVTRSQAQQLLLGQRVGDLLLMPRDEQIRMGGVQVRVGREDEASIFDFLEPRDRVDVRQKSVSDCFPTCDPCAWLRRISPPSPYGKDYGAARRHCAEGSRADRTPRANAEPRLGEKLIHRLGSMSDFPLIETPTPERLEEKRRELEERMKRSAE